MSTDCEFSPSTPLTSADKSVTISYTLGDTVLTYEQELYMEKYIEYIESTGSQYIKTGVKPADISRIEFSFVTKLVDGNWRSVFYTELNSSPYNGMGLRVHTNKTLSFQYGASVAAAPVTAVVGTKYNVDWRCKSNELILNEESYPLGPAGAMAGTELYLFANNVAGSPAQYGSIRLHHIKFYGLDDELIRDYRPCLDKTEVVCLKEKVSGTYVYNNGSGTFIAGPEKTVEEVEE